MRLRQFAILLLFPQNLYAQNLIPNPSFEEVELLCGYTISPEHFQEAVEYWTMPSYSRPDIYSNDLDSQCSNYYNTNASVEPRDGVNVACLCVFADQSNYREYLQVPLLQKLRKNKTYYVDFWLSPVIYSKYAINNLGIFLSEKEVFQKTYEELFYHPDVLFSEVVFDTLNWTHVKGKFKASNEAQYLIIGNFSKKEDLKIEMIREELPFKNSGAIYFIDDVYLGEKPRYDEVAH